MHSITIGIPAYNEEKNIYSLLRNLLAQRQKNITIRSIIVLSDCSTDDTDKIVQSLADPKIKLLRNQSRIGQALSQNILISKSRGDIVVLLNGDIKIDSEKFLENLCLPILHDSTIGMVAARSIPLPATTFFSKILAYSTKYKKELFQQVDNGNNIYNCVGRARAFSPEFSRVICWPNIVNEDSYSYLTCISHGFRFRYEDKAICKYKLPANYIDHAKQSSRFACGPGELTHFFPQKKIDKAFYLPKVGSIIISLRYFFKNPLIFFLYTVITIRIRIFPIHTTDWKSLWDQVVSTK